MTERAKILLVDDLDENLLALAALLRRDDVDLLQARSGREALEHLLANDVALAFLDVQMPEMDGFELAELMRGSERTRHVPIIFVTAGMRDQQRIFRGYESGAVDFLYKPIDPQILKNKTDVFLQLYFQKYELAKQLRERTESLRLNEMFIAVLGHDLRDPLSAIMTSAQLLGYSQDAAVQETGQRIGRAGNRMSRMISDMLDLARARLAGGIVLNVEPADMSVLARRVLQEHEGRKRQFDFDQQGDLTGTWDPNRLAQAISNLVANAISHGAVDAPIGISLEGTSAASATFSITNKGTIADEVLARLFEPFGGGQRPEGSKRQGLGLGLYIVKQIAEAHAGSVEVNTSAEGRVEFRFTVPRYRKGVERAPD